MARPDSLRIEIPAGPASASFWCPGTGGFARTFRGDDAMFEGPATREVMDGLFGIDLAPDDLVGAILARLAGGSLGRLAIREGPAHAR